MKKIVCFFIAFSGICTALAQKPAGPYMPDSIRQNEKTAGQSKGNDSTAAITKPSVRLYPNPAVNRVEITIKGFEPGFVQVIITDQIGKTTREEERMVFSGHEIITVMFSMKQGIYFLAVKQGKKLARSKLVIQ